MVEKVSHGVLSGCEVFLIHSLLAHILSYQNDRHLAILIHLSCLIKQHDQEPLKEIIQRILSLLVVK